MQVQITCSEAQAKLLIRALDLYSRIGCLQLEEILEHHSILQVMGAQNPDTKILLSKRDTAKRIINVAKAVMADLAEGSSFSVLSPELNDCVRVTWDMLKVIRNKLAKHEKPEGGFTIEFDTPDVSSHKDVKLIEVEICP